MALVDLLTPAQHGQFFANLGAAAGLPEAEAEAAMARLGPAIAEKLKARAESDPHAFEALLDLIEDEDATPDINDATAMTDAEAVQDGLAILSDLYGSPAAAQAALAPLVPGMADRQFALVAGLATTSLLAALTVSTTPQPAATLQAAATANDDKGFWGTLVSAIVAGAAKEAMRQVTPKKRRRRTTTSSIFGTKRRTTRRRRTRKTTLETIFSHILTGRR